MAANQPWFILSGSKSTSLVPPSGHGGSLSNTSLLLDWQNKIVMSLDAVTGISLVFLCSSIASDGSHEDLRSYYNNTELSCRATDLEWSSSDENLEQNGYAQEASDSTTEEKSKPLILTPYVMRGQFQEGIKAARVTTTKIKSYSGFFKVSNRRMSYMFFWYFSAMSKKYRGKPDTPVIMWIQGGMGQSSLLGAFRENGPIRLKPNGKMVSNKWSWADRAHLVYFDSPVGVGYSYTKSGKYPTSQEEVATDLYVALRQFLRLFGLIRNPFFIAGQDYAGKTIAALGALIHKRKKSFPVNLHGVAIGNGFVDPPNMLGYGKLLYQLGFIDEKMRNELQSVRKKIQEFLKKGKETEAVAEYSKYIQDTMNASFIDRETALASKLDYTQVRRGINEEDILGKYLNVHSIPRALHTTGVPFVQNNPEVRKAMWPHLLKSQVKNLKFLMNRSYRVLLYHGQMSILNAYPLVLEFLGNLRWRDGRKYRRAERVQWKVYGELAGYFKTGGKFTELLMRNAGCRVSADQPKWAQHMINKFIFDEDFNSK